VVYTQGFEHLPIFEDAKVLKLVVIASSLSNLVTPAMIWVWRYLHWRLQCLVAECWSARPEPTQDKSTGVGYSPANGSSRTGAEIGTVNSPRDRQIVSPPRPLSEGKSLHEREGKTLPLAINPSEVQSRV
jgi:hypothetical protein